MSTSTKRGYEALHERFGEIGRLQAAAGILNWDMETVMPPGSAKDRAEQLGALNTVIHGLLADPRVGQWLEEANDSDLGPWQRANVREMRRLHEHERALSPGLVTAITRATTECQMVWRKARPANDFAALLPRLDRVFSLVRQKAEAKGEVLGCAPYDALLDEFDPGSSSERIDKLFDALAGFLPDLIESVLLHQAEQPPVLQLEGPFSVAQQRDLGQRVMRALAFDFEHGRLDVSAHPFTGGTPDDVRITTRYNESSFAESLMGVIHETGHALYELGLPPDWRYQPVGQSRGMSAHESQSLIIEMQACRSQSFLRWAAPVMREVFGRSGEAWEVDNLHRFYTKVERGLIRVDADEVTYPAHVVLRYRLERQLVAGELAVEDLPEAWRAAMGELLGVVPETDRDGCMQDIHWVAGIVGYFPSYTLGAMAAAQLFEAALVEQPSIPRAMERGEFAPLVDWLRTHIHGRGARGTFDELLLDATGKPLTPAIYEANLRRRYLHA